MSAPWIPVAGRDAGPHYPSWINPAGVLTATWWTNRGNQRTLTLELVTGRKVELVEPEAHDVVARVIRGDEDDDAPPPLEPAAAACGRRAA